uniref:ACB domain-containing protein n=1 Tax=Panagrolaimus superbus TaxID=310955 RepID=A0A914ZCJ1_9BILA
MKTTEEDNVTEIPENIDEMFDAAVEIVQNLPKKGPVSASYDQMLSFYSLYKQATKGPCKMSQPPFWNPVEKYKWSGWHSLGNMDSKKAKYIYLTKIQKKIDEVLESYDVTEWMGGDSEKLETFLRPKFKLIGREIMQKSDDDKIEPEKTLKENDVTTENYKYKTGIDEVFSDDEYDDAIDAPTMHQKISSIQHSNHDNTGIQSFKSYFETHVNNLTQQVKTLSHALTEQNKMVTQFMKEMSRIRREGVGGVSWWMFAFFLLWPFIAHQVIRIIIRRLQIVL